MDKISDRVRESNQEGIIIDKKLVNIKEHLALNKIMIGIRKELRIRGFFKIVNGDLQLHICRSNSDGKKTWSKLLVLDANEDELANNKRLNVFESRDKKP